MQILTAHPTQDAEHMTQTTERSLEKLSIVVNHRTQSAETERSTQTTDSENRMKRLTQNSD